MKYKLFIYTTIFIFIIKNTFCDNLADQLNDLRKSNFETTKIFENEHYYFSQASEKYKKNTIRKQISRKLGLLAIENLKNHLIDKYPNINLQLLKNWGSKSYLKEIIKLRNTRKVNDLRKNDFHIVVYSFPKDQIKIKKEQINLSEILKFGYKNHFNFSKNDRYAFIKNLEFNDLILLWEIKNLKLSINLNNVVKNVDPIKYQKLILKFWNKPKTKISYLNELPSTKFIVRRYLNENKKINSLIKLSYETSICSHDENFLKSLKVNNIYVIKKKLFDKNHKFYNAVNLCNGFLNFSKDIVKPTGDSLKEIEALFKKGKRADLPLIIKLLENYLAKNPLNFKAWNFYSACLRAQKKFDLAYLVSRIEIGLALDENNLNNYLEGLRSYSKSIIMLGYKITNNQKKFLDFVIQT